MTTLLIQACAVLDERAPNGYVEARDILIRDHLIEWVRPAGAAVAADQVIDGRHLLAIPGLINAHTHSPENVLRGTTECLPLELWLVQHYAFRAAFPPRLIYLMTMAGAAEMLRSGTTAVLDHFWMAGPLTGEGLEAVMQAYDDAGMRASVAPMLEDCDLMADAMVVANTRLGTLLAADGEARLNADALLGLATEFLARWHGHDGGRLRGLPGPGGPQWCSEPLLKGCRDLAERFDTSLHMHLAETATQARICRQEYGHPAVLEMDRLGLLATGTSLAHCIWVGDDELEVIARRQACVVHNPASNLKLGAGLARVPAMRQRNIPVALGTDGAASNDNQDMFTVLKLSGLLHSPATGACGWLDARAAFEMATQGGARAIGEGSRLGTIREGCLADIVLLDLGNSYVEPLPDAYRHLVFCETGASVRHSIVHGRLVVENSRLLTQPEADVWRELRERMAAYVEQHPRPLQAIRVRLEEWARALELAETRDG